TLASSGLNEAVHPAQLEHVLREIDADDADFSQGCPLLQLVFRHRRLGTLRCRLGRAASTPSLRAGRPVAPLLTASASARTASAYLPRTPRWVMVNPSGDLSPYPSMRSKPEWAIHSAPSAVATGASRPTPTARRTAPRA